MPKLKKIKRVLPEITDDSVEDLLSYRDLIGDLNEVLTFLPPNSFLRKRIVTCAEIVNLSIFAIQGNYEENQDALNQIEEMLR
jgi:hypothetical protein